MNKLNRRTQFFRFVLYCTWDPYQDPIIIWTIYAVRDDHIVGDHCRSDDSLASPPRSDWSCNAQFNHWTYLWTTNWLLYVCLVWSDFKIWILGGQADEPIIYLLCRSDSSSITFRSNYCWTFSETFDIFLRYFWRLWITLGTYLHGHYTFCTSVLYFVNLFV